MKRDDRPHDGKPLRNWWGRSVHHDVKAGGPPVLILGTPRAKIGLIELGDRREAIRVENRQAPMA